MAGWVFSTVSGGCSSFFLAQTDIGILVSGRYARQLLLVQFAITLEENVKDDVRKRGLRVCPAPLYHCIHRNISRQSRWECKQAGGDAAEGESFSPIR